LKLGKVIGTVVSVRKVNNLKSLKLMVVEYLDDNLQSQNKTAVCTDTVSAGEGDIVLVCSSSSARLTSTTKDACTDNSIIGIVDSVSSNNSYIYFASEET
jgi:microcompartment protein CcmK/EutM